MHTAAKNNLSKTEPFETWESIFRVNNIAAAVFSAAINISQLLEEIVRVSFLFQTFPCVRLTILLPLAHGWSLAALLIAPLVTQAPTTPCAGRDQGAQKNWLLLILPRQHLQ